MIDTSLLKLLEVNPDAPPAGYGSRAPADSTLIESIVDVLRVPEP